LETFPPKPLPRRALSLFWSQVSPSERNPLGTNPSTTPETPPTNSRFELSLKRFQAVHTPLLSSPVHSPFFSHRRTVFVLHGQLPLLSSLRIFISAPPFFFRFLSIFFPPLGSVASLRSRVPQTCSSSPFPKEAPFPL